MKNSSLAYYLVSVRKILRRNGLKVVLNPLKVYREIVNLNLHRRTLSLLGNLDYSYSDLSKNKELMAGFNQMKHVQVHTINWFIPNVKHVFGGVYTVLRFADYFHSQKGIQNRFIVYSGPLISASDFMKKIAKSFPGLSREEAIILRNQNVNTIPYADVSIATIWDSAYLLLKFNNTKGKFYFIQDYEPLFYPAGSVYALAEATYRFGFYGIVNSPGVSDIITKDYDATAEYFIPSVDRQIFYPAKRNLSTPSDENPFTIFFYARPETARNAFDLGVSALRKIKSKYGKKVRIYAAGSDWHPEDYDMENTIISLGTLPYEETAALYRKCNLGIVFMFTKHPSYLPFELMACGCPVLTNYNPSTTWLFKDGENCILAEPTATCVSERIETLIKHPEMRTRLISNGLKSVGEITWESQIEKIYKFICYK